MSGFIKEKNNQSGIKEATMAKKKILYIDNYFPSLDDFNEIMAPYDVDVIDAQLESEAEAAKLAGDVFAIVTSDVTIGETILSAAPDVKIVVRQAAGIETLDIPEATKRGVMVCYVPDYCRHEVAEHAIALLMSLSRKINLGIKRMANHQFDYKPLRPIYSLREKTLGFLGFGGNAQMVAKKMSGFEFDVRYYDPFIKESPVPGAKPCSLDELLKSSDYLSIHAPETEETHHIINAKTLAMMKPTALIINTARGGLIDTPALISSLQRQEIAGAALDVVENELTLCPDNELCGMDNVILTPHYAWHSEDSMKALQVETAKEVARALNNERPKNLLNPEVLT